MRLVGSIVAAVFASTLPATLPAQIFVVDASNGPGANFTDIATAVAAVPDGSTLVVRTGTYAPFTITAKGLTVLCQPPVQISSGLIAVSNTQLSQSIVLANFGVFGPPGSPPRTPVAIDLVNCAGPVLVDSLAGFLTAASCSQLSLRDSVVDSTAFSNCVAVIEGSRLTGRNAVMLDCVNRLWTPAAPGLWLVGGTTQSSGCTIEGGWGVPGYSWPCVNLPGTTGVILDQGASLRLLDGRVSAGAGSSGWVNAIDVRGTPGSLRIDPQTTLETWIWGVVNPGNPHLIYGWVEIPSIPRPGQSERMPGLASTDAPLQGTLTATVRDPIGDIAILLIGLPGAPISVPGFADAFWMDPAAYSFAAIGMPLGGQPVTATVQVPNQPHLRGFRVAWQAVTFNPVTGFQASNPSTSHVD